MLKEFATYIGNNTGFTLGTDLEVGQWNTENSINSTLVTEPGGGNVKLWTDARSARMIQVVSRGTTYFTARAAAFVVYDLLNIRGEITLPILTSGEIFVVEQVVPVAPPQNLPGQDEGGNFLYSTNYQVHVRED